MKIIDANNIRIHSHYGGRSAPVTVEDARGWAKNIKDRASMLTDAQKLERINETLEGIKFDSLNEI